MGFLLKALKIRRSPAANANPAKLASSMSTSGGSAPALARLAVLALASQDFRTRETAEEDQIDERAAVAFDSGVPESFVDGWARMQCQRLQGVPEAWHHRAVDCTGRMLDRHGRRLAATGWTVEDLFDRPLLLGSTDYGSTIDLREAGLAWQLRHGDVIDALDTVKAIIKHPDGKSWTFLRRGSRTD